MSRRVFLLGASGTIGRAALSALQADGHEVGGLLRARNRPEGQLSGFRSVSRITRDQIDAALKTFRPDTIVSCIASRTGTPSDAWDVDYGVNLDTLEVAQRTGVESFVLLSAICVQRPKLAFQEAKLAFEAKLKQSGLTYAIVRPTAYFKSLSGQIDRLRAGKPFLVFGDGRMTACKPISDRDLGRFLSQCVTDPALWNRVLPIGGAGPALTPLDMGAELFRLLGSPPRYRHVPMALMDGIVGLLSLASPVSARLREKAELARIGRYYASESMLVWDPVAGRYDADATPEFGDDHLFDHYAEIIRSDTSPDLGAHAVF